MEPQPESSNIIIKIKQKKIKEVDSINNIYIKSLLTREVCVKVFNIGTNINDTLERIISSEIEGKCTIEGYIKPNSVKIQSYSSGLIVSDNIVFVIVIECQICCPVEGMTIRCTAQNITKAGIRAQISKENNPVLIFVARDHNFMSSYFNSIQENQEITVKVIGQRFELNDTYFSIIGELIEQTASIIPKPRKKLPKLILNDEIEEVLA